ncbi:MAG: hypothetical protein HRU38_22265 [Saccharospirillaceae bacterium]|nr:hypothetical protein [Pseudomonadales bacterium]NRB81354.1 hypothetical protein [Saccharospirillaceae bacterium]
MSKNLIIDTNLLLLLVIGAVEEGRHIQNSKRLNAFNLSDYDNVLKIMGEYNAVFITPYIATEVSNLIDLKGYAQILAFKIARTLFSEFKEIDVNLNEDCESDLFLRFGLTDNSLIKLAPDYYILTNDHRMLEPLFESSQNTIIPYYTLK